MRAVYLHQQGHSSFHQSSHLVITLNILQLDEDGGGGGDLRSRAGAGDLAGGMAAGKVTFVEVGDLPSIHCHVDVSKSDRLESACVTSRSFRGLQVRLESSLFPFTPLASSPTRAKPVPSPLASANSTAWRLSRML